MPLNQALHQAQGLAGRLPPLLIAAERVAQSVYQGVHGRRRAGVGETFWQFRRYEAGDPTERIDWRQSARTDKVFVREREWEAAQTACLWADMSGSMQFASHKNNATKAERAQLLMLALASLCLRGGENVFWLDRRPLTVRGKNGLQRIVAQMAGAIAASNTAIPQYSVPRHAHMVLCSDFLMPPERLQESMKTYAAQKISGTLLHILDPVEAQFSYQGRLDISGLEAEPGLLVPDAGAIQKAYAEKMAEHKALLAHIAASAGWHYLSHVTTTAPHLPLLQVYRSMSVT